MPTIFPFKSEPKARQSKNSIKPLASPTATPQKKKKPSVTQTVKTPSAAKLQIKQPVDHDYIVTKELDLSDDIKRYLPEIEQKMKELNEVQEKNEMLKSQILSIDQIKNQPKAVQFWTGFPSYETFLAVFKYLEPRAKSMKYWKGGKSTYESENFLCLMKTNQDQTVSYEGHLESNAHSSI